MGPCPTVLPQYIDLVSCALVSGRYYYGYYYCYSDGYYYYYYYSATMHPHDHASNRCPVQASKRPPIDQIDQGPAECAERLNNKDSGSRK